MSWDWFVFSVNWHCQRHQVSAVIYTGCCGILNMFFLCWVSTNIHSWHPLAWLVIDSLTGTGHWWKMHIGFRLCAGRCCHPLFDSSSRMRMCGREWLEPSCCLRTLLYCQDGLDPHCACWWDSSPPSAQVCFHAPTPTPSPPLTPILPKPPPHVLHQIRKWEGMEKCSETLTSQIQIYLCLSNSHVSCDY